MGDLWRYFRAGSIGGAIAMLIAGASLILLEAQSRDFILEKLTDTFILGCFVIAIVLFLFTLFCMYMWDRSIHNRALNINTVVKDALTSQKRFNRMTNDLDMADGFFKYHNAWFGIEPRAMGNLWEEFTIDMDGAPRCPSCQYRLDHPSDDKLICKNSECKNPVDITIENQHRFVSEARDNMVFGIRDWKKGIRKKSPK